MRVRARHHLPRGGGPTALTPEDGVALLAKNAARGPVALVLGGEKRGLSDDDLRHCQAVCAIHVDGPAVDEPRAGGGGAALPLLARAGPRARTEPIPGAQLGTVQALEARMRAALLVAGF